MKFDELWRNVLRGMIPYENEDLEDFMHRVSCIAYSHGETEERLKHKRDKVTQ